MFEKYKAIWVSVIIALLVLGSVGASAAVSAGAAGDTAGSNVIYAAYQKASGILRYISDPSQATNSEVVISWNQVGPQGSPGPQGPNGPVGPQGPAGPAVPQPPSPTLLTLADNVTVQPGVRFTTSPPQDVKSFRSFTLYARLMPAPSTGPGDQPTQPPVWVTVRETALGVQGEGSYWEVIAIPGPVPLGGTWPEPHWLWNGPGTGTNPPPARWTNVSRFGGLFSKLNASVYNMDTVPVTISLYLLMATE